jgi:hypothetical protein
MFLLFSPLKLWVTQNNVSFVFAFES